MLGSGMRLKPHVGGKRNASGPLRATMRRFLTFPCPPPEGCRSERKVSPASRKATNAEILGLGVRSTPHADKHTESGPFRATMWRLDDIPCPRNRSGRRVDEATCRSTPRNGHSQLESNSAQHIESGVLLATMRCVDFVQREDRRPAERTASLAMMGWGCSLFVRTRLSVK